MIILGVTGLKSLGTLAVQHCVQSEVLLMDRVFSLQSANLVWDGRLVPLCVQTDGGLLQCNKARMGFCSIVGAVQPSFLNNLLLSI